MRNVGRFLELEDSAAELEATQAAHPPRSTLTDIYLHVQDNVEAATTDDGLFELFEAPSGHHVSDLGQESSWEGD